MRRATAVAAICAASLTQLPASAAPDKPAPPTKIVFFAPTDGPLAATAEEAFAGVKSALAGGADVELSRDAPKKPRAYDAWFAELEKRGVALALAFVADGETAAVEKAAVAAKVPLIVLSPEETKPDLDPSRNVFWAGGLRPADEALAAMDFLLTPLFVHAPAVFHDGSARGKEIAEKCARLHHFSQTPHAPTQVADDFGVADVKGVLGRHASAAAAADATAAGEGADGIVYFGGPAGAERLLAACAAAKIEAPVLLGEGLVSRAVPTFVDGHVPAAWALEAAYYEDYKDGKGSPASDIASVCETAAKDTGGKLFAATVRGVRAGRWIVEALRKAPESPEKKPERKLPWALRAIAREGARGKPVFEPWGHASLARLEPWRSPKWRDDPPCTRVRPTYLPVGGIPHVGDFSAASYKWEPGSFYVWMHWGKPEERTIERDMAAIGLDPGEGELRARMIDDLMGRAISRMNRLYLRNIDGAAIPGVSYNVTFGTEEKPAGLKNSHRFEMVLRGDDPDKGGVAHGTTCEVFTTYLERTIYARRAFKPPIAAADAEYVDGKYRWELKALDKNLRGDSLRALQDGYTQAMGLTGAHECGHMFGLGHDTATPRSIMNVVEAVDLEFEWAEWSPDHAKILEARLGRTPVPK
jgi:ABC-type branched-subunit amino acid transport system substrate-binding protein